MNILKLLMPLPSVNIIVVWTGIVVDHYKIGIYLLFSNYFIFLFSSHRPLTIFNVFKNSLMKMKFACVHFHEWEENKCHMKMKYFAFKNRYGINYFFLQCMPKINPFVHYNPSSLLFFLPILHKFSKQ